MNLLDSVLFGMLAGAITLKVVLLAIAAVLLVHALAKRAGPARVTNAVSRTRHPRINAHG
jgi:hypothetical protein